MVIRSILDRDMHGGAIYTFRAPSDKVVIYLPVGIIVFFICSCYCRCLGRLEVETVAC